MLHGINNIYTGCPIVHFHVLLLLLVVVVVVVVVVIAAAVIKIRITIILPVFQMDVRLGTSHRGTNIS